jgi:signal transduction histidine kinase
MMRKTINWYFIFCMCSFCFSSAKNIQNTNSLYNSILIQPNDTSKLSSYANFIEKCTVYRNDSLVNLVYDKGVALALKLKSKHGLMAMNYWKGFYNDDTLQEDYFNKTLKLSNDLKDAQFKAAALSGLGYVAQNKGEFTKAMILYTASLQLSESAGIDEYTVYRYYDIGMLFRDEGKYAEALEYFKKALSLATSIHKLDAMTQFTAGICSVHIITGNLDSAWHYLQQNTKLANELNHDDAYYQNIRKYGQFYSAQKKYFKADSCYNELEKFQMKRGETLALKETGEWCDILLQLHRTAKALQLIPGALQKLDRAYLHARVQCLNTFAQVYEQAGNIKEALRFYKKYEALKDSLLFRQKVTEFSEMEVKFKTNEKEKEIKLLNAEQKAKDVQIKKQTLIRNFSIALVAFVIFISIVLFNRQQLKQKTEKLTLELQRQKEIEKERTRIGADLHDDIGSNLTSIALLSEVAKSSADKSLTEKNLNMISSSAGELIDKMSEIIWAMNSKNDTLENLIAYLREYASEYFEPYEIKLKIEISETIPHHVFNSQLRRTIFLVVKESLHNIIKHAEATEVNMKFDIDNKRFSVCICDNGKGFDLNDVRRFGNGLHNMKNRLSEIKADYKIISEPEKGTTTHLNIPF